MKLNPEFADNPDPRAACVLLLDTSASMSSSNAIGALNDGLIELKNELMRDSLAKRRVEIAIVTFGGQVTHSDFVVAEDFTPDTLFASGSTPMGEAVNRGLDLLQARKNIYSANGISYYRPWLFLITDGGPTDDWQAASRRLVEEAQNDKVLPFCVGVEGADFDILRQFTIDAIPPAKLKGLSFGEMFRWVSASQKALSHSNPGDQVRLNPITGWGEVTS